MKFFRKPKFLVPVLLLLILLIVGSVAGYALGKYRTDLVMTDTVSRRTQLVDSFRLSVVRSDGRSETDETGADTAWLIPGTALQLRFSIEGKTALRSWLYVEITGSVDAAQLAEGWRLLEGVTGKHGGAVYAYREILDGAQPDMSVEILRGGLTLEGAPEQDDPELSFCGYLLQITSEPARGEDAARTVFVNKFPQN